MAITGGFGTAKPRKPGGSRRWYKAQQRHQALAVSNDQPCVLLGQTRPTQGKLRASKRANTWVKKLAGLRAMRRRACGHTRTN